MLFSINKTRIIHSNLLKMLNYFSFYIIFFLNLKFSVLTTYSSVYIYNSFQFIGILFKTFEII